MSTDRLLILDFDGVIADSEGLAHAALAESITALGHPTTPAEAMRLYMGKRSGDVLAAIAVEIGRPLPAGFAEGVRARNIDLFRAELRPVSGAPEFLAAFRGQPKCIASQSSPERLALCLDVLGMAREFNAAVFSAVEVPRGKPAPDLFLHSASRMGVAPERAIVIEDSVGGVQAARAAGMTAIGLLAASHLEPGHGAHLHAAGAHHVARDFQEAERIVRELLAE